MQPINLIVSCTNRKKVAAPELLCLRSLKRTPISRRLEQWRDRLAKVDVQALPAANLYAGDHWHVAQSIPQEGAEVGLDVRLWVCSAGYGLIRESRKIKPYSATFTPNHQDSVGSSAREKSNGATGRDWWSGLSTYSFSRKKPRNVTGLAKLEPRVPILIVASEPYLQAMAEDLETATGVLASEGLLSILSVGANVTRLPALSAHLLPADARFEAVVGGTRAALNARIARFLIQQFDSGVLPSVTRLASMLNALSTTLPPLQRFDRRKLSDEEVRQFIGKARIETPEVSKTALLRQLRDSGAACEQGRFSTLFAQATEDSNDAA